MNHLWLVLFAKQYNLKQLYKNHYCETAALRILGEVYLFIIYYLNEKRIIL